MENNAGPFFGLIMLVLIVAVYIYVSYSIQKIAERTNTPNAWLAWIPIANVFLTIKIAGRPGWWFILMLIPFINIVISIVVWMGIAERVGKPSWLGILIIIPPISLIVPGYLAFSQVTPAPSPVNTPPTV